MGIHKLSLGYFDQQVLAAYRNEPDKWSLESDNFEGHLQITEWYYNLIQKENRDEYVDIRFGYRALKSGELALAVWLPDLLDKSKSQFQRWQAFHMPNPDCAVDDQRFELWVRRYLKGDWSVQSGPRSQLEGVIEIIQGLTAVALGLPLFKHPIPRTLPFPSAQNTHRYQDAHKDLYGYLIDGIDKECLKQVSRLVNITPNIDSGKTLDTLKPAFPV